MKQNKKSFIILCCNSSICLYIECSTAHTILHCKQKQNTQQMPQKVYQSKEGTIAYSVYGTGRPLLLLHNTEVGASGTEWQNNIESLSRMYQVFVPDLPGFGNSQN